ncbi:hypothetical protein B4N89_00150 [Embleya scabrispora]|uniref:Peptidase S8/S53 domain-containing protein n=1 Tax=Embleya scabrispora TaxID=159449 RepID=A0A1T3NRP1_9ACTN|nr:S8 family serine peptidase [Embleya scabrispora]OPC79567.1 hypothetical protein B4N89_00150 [Embleya scabrispora]
MWTISRGAGVTVAVIDTGVDGGHPDLRGRVLPGIDVVTGFRTGRVDTGQSDVDGHVTSVSSVIAGTGAGHGSTPGVIGIAPDARILPIKAHDRDNPFGSHAIEPTAIRAAADSEAKINNISLSGTPWRQEEEAVRYALGKGRLIVASRGNEVLANTAVGYSAAYPGVLAVAGVKSTKDGTTRAELWDRATRGPQVSLAAPVEAIPVACLPTQHASRCCVTNGTSFSSPIVAGTAALVWSKHPDWTDNQAIRRLVDTAVQLPDSTTPNDFVGYGVVRPRQALQSTADPGPPT